MGPSVITFRARAMGSRPRWASSTTATRCRPPGTALLAALGPGGAAPRVVVLVHGLMCTEDVFRFPEGGGDYGSFLSRDAGFTPLYVRYNSGLAIADNGLALSALLGKLVAAWPAPLEEIVLVGYSMGGLVLRGAFHYASLEGAPWLALAKRAIYVGTPHRGSPLERAGRALSRLLEAIPDPYTRLVADLANLRSDGVKDLGDGDVRHEDRARGGASLSLRDPAHPVPLLPEIAHFLVAGSVSSDPLVARLFGDALVPVPSATDGVCHRLDEMVFPTEMREDPARARACRARASPGRLCRDPRLSRGGFVNEAAWKKLRGLRALAFDMVDHGSRAIERVQKETADRPFAILESIGPIAAPARGVHAALDLSFTATHAAVRIVSHAVGRGLDVALDVAERLDAERGASP